MGSWTAFVALILFNLCVYAKSVVKTPHQCIISGVRPYFISAALTLCCGGYARATMAPSASFTPNMNHNNDDIFATFQSITAVAEMIRIFSPTTLRASLETGNLLYRGEPNIGTTPALIYTAPDLLIPGTYASPLAIDYFKTLDEALSTRGVVARPSLSHLTTPVAMDASRWGPITSIWPLENLKTPLSGQLHTCYLSPLAAGATTSPDGAFWQDDFARVQPVSEDGILPPRPPFFWHTEQGISDVLHSCVVDSALSVALSTGREVMFSSIWDERSLGESARRPGITIKSSSGSNHRKSSDGFGRNAYIAVPAVLEAALRRELLIPDERVMS